MYQPNKKIIQRYADVIVNFALGGGRGIKKGDVVYVAACEYAKPLYAGLLSAIMKAGGHTISSYRPDDDRVFSMSRDFYVNAQDHQINFFPSKYFRGLIDEIDHFIFIASETDMEALKGIDPKKIMARGQALKPFHDWRNEKENRGEFTWTIALYGTEAMAKEAGLSEKEYWSEIIKACFLENPHPINKWRDIQKQIINLKHRLTGLKIEKLHVNGPDADLWLALGKERAWDGGDGRNIPGFEVFTSPDWRGTNGWIKFNQPVYTHGHLIKSVSLEFKKGVVVKARATANQKLLEAIITTPNGDKVGEFSLTDKRFSKITKFMAETLYDENVGGPNGNTHIALGDSFHGCYAGNPAKLKKGDWAKLGFNNSAVHQDIISTAPRTVTAYLKNGKELVIYRNGMFIV